MVAEIVDLCSQRKDHDLMNQFRLSCSLSTLLRLDTLKKREIFFWSWIHLASGAKAVSPKVNRLRSADMISKTWATRRLARASFRVLSQAHSEPEKSIRRKSRLWDIRDSMDTIKHTPLD